MGYGDSRFSVAHEKAFRHTAEESRRREFPSPLARRRDRVFASLWQQKHPDAVLAMTCSEAALDRLEAMISERTGRYRNPHPDPMRTFSLADIPAGFRSRAAVSEPVKKPSAPIQITESALDYLVRTGQITKDSAQKLKELA